MNKIQTLLSSTLTALLITSNNAYAAFAISNAVFADQPNKNSSVRFNQKRNRLGDDISGYGYRNILKKGNVFKGNVRVFPRNGTFIGVPPDPKFNPPKQGYTDSGRVTYIRSGKDGFIVQTGDGLGGKDSFIGKNGLSDDTHLGSAIGIPPEPELRSDNNLLPAVQVNNYNCKDVSGNCMDKSSTKLVGQEAKAVGDKTWNELKPRALGPDVVTTLEHGPGLHDSYDTGTAVDALQQPKGVPLQFINGEWVEGKNLKPYAWP